MTQQFIITLSSNVVNEFEQNTISNYRTVLSKRIVLPQNEKWMVGLRQITFKKTWYNVQNKSEIRFINTKGEFINVDDQKEKTNYYFTENDDLHFNEKGLMKIFVLPGHYHTIDDLISNLNKKLKFFKDFVGAAPFISFDEITKKIRIVAGIIPNKDEIGEYDLFFPTFGEEIENILGLVQTNGFSFQNYIQRLFKAQNKDVSRDKLFINGFQVVKFNDKFENLFVYTDIIQHSPVGNTTAPLLCTVPIQSDAKYGDVINFRFAEPDFIPLQATNFDIIEVDVKDDSNKSVKFKSGRVLIRLLFKKYE